MIRPLNCNPAFARAGPACAVLLAACLAWWVGPSRAGPPARGDNLYKKKGYWEPPRTWANNIVPISAVILRGDTTHSQVMAWADIPARLWQWNPGDTLTPVPTLSKFISVDNITLIHGAGLATLSDGKLLASGGTTHRTVGTRYTRLFDPMSRTWTLLNNMYGVRWYTTSTIRGDGTVLETSGLKYPLMYTFGGANAAGQALREARAITPGATLGWTDTADVSAVVATAREGARAIFSSVLGGMAVFGGRRGAAYLNDIWTLRYNYQTDIEGVWTADSLPLIDAAFPKPPPRFRHGFTQNRTNDTLWAFGGLDSAGRVLGDVWRLPIKQVGRSHWESVSPTGGGPGPRSGHVMIYDEGSRLAPDKAARLLVLGGRDSAGAVSNVTWALTNLGPGQTPAWVAAAVQDSSAAAREGHVAVYDRSNVYPKKRILVFGGSGPGGVLYNDAWVLGRTDTSVVSQATEPWKWSRANVGNSKPLPSPRTRSAAAYDEDSYRFLISGGETAGGKVSDIWSLDVTDPSQSALTVWDSTPGDPPAHGPMPVARDGEVAAYDARGVTNLLPELFHPATAQWDTVPNGHRLQFPFPRMFVLPSGRLFHAGSDSMTAVLDLNNHSSPWTNVGSTHFESWGGAMFEPGKILMCGGLRSGGKKSAWIDMTQPVPAWQSTNDMDTLRMEMGLTLLPNGEAIATGGEVDINDRVATAVRRPQIWTPVTHSWKPDTLAPNPSIRDHHSTAMLLPDGRIFSSGGLSDLPDPHLVTIYWPPYLFTDSGAVAPRPTVVSMDSAIAGGDSLRVVLNPADSIVSACLMRPNCVTHDFDQNQRYLPLVLHRTGAGTYRARVPAWPDSLPPGDHLFYVVDSHGVPSIGRWVRVSQTTQSLTAEPGTQPPGFALLPTAPNPFSTSTRIQFRLARQARVDVGIFSVEGRLVRRLARGILPQGITTLHWDGLVSSGVRAPSGIYFLRLDSAGQRAQRALVLLR